MEELEIVHPETGVVLGASLPRAEAIATGAWCRSTNVFVMNSKGEILCHQRSLEKERMPGVWSTHLGGHVSKGENYETNALKELEEEAGIKIHAQQLFSWRTTRIEKARLWVREFVTIANLDLDDLIPQPGEVQGFAWLHVDDILRAKAEQPDKWCAGTHDFKTEYQCLRSVVAAARANGAFTDIPEEIHIWHPVAM